MSNCNSIAKEYLVSSVAELNALAETLVSALCGGQIVGLRGDLGAGKTELARAIIHAFGFVGDVASPTFTLENWFDLPQSSGAIKSISHWDLYRIGRAPEDLLEMEVAPDTLVLVEWPELSAELGRRISKTIELVGVTAADLGKPPQTCKSPGPEVEIENIRRIVLHGF